MTAECYDPVKGQMGLGGNCLGSLQHQTRPVGDGIATLRVHMPLCQLPTHLRPGHTCLRSTVALDQFLIKVDIHSPIKQALLNSPKTNVLSGLISTMLQT